jgi:hypothetical protein
MATIAQSFPIINDECRIFTLSLIIRVSYSYFRFLLRDVIFNERLCGLGVWVPGNKSRGPGSIPDAAEFSEK